MKAIAIDNIGKRYRIGKHEGQADSFRELLVNTVKSPFSYLTTQLREATEEEMIWAIRNVSFEVDFGEVVALIGKNGAGKSTLLKILSRITSPTEGQALLNGRVGSLLEVGTGFHPDLTGRENIYLNGTILGMRRTEIDGKLDEIIAFSGVEKFIDTPVKRYSSGMKVRLAFAVAAHLEPEILLIDEVLAVGDAEFQRKCLGKMSSVAKEGRTVIFVSHNLAAVENLCHRGVVFINGRMEYLGDQTEAIQYYLQSTENDAQSTNLRDRADRIGTGEVRVVHAEFRDRNGNPLTVLTSGQDVQVALDFELGNWQATEPVDVSISFYTHMGVMIFTQSTQVAQAEFRTLPKSGTFLCNIPDVPLPPGLYKMGFSIRQGHQKMDEMHFATDLSVAEGDFFKTGKVLPQDAGVVLVRGNWALED